MAGKEGRSGRSNRERGRLLLRPDPGSDRRGLSPFTLFFAAVDRGPIPHTAGVRSLRLGLESFWQRRLQGQPRHRKSLRILVRRGRDHRGRARNRRLSRAPGGAAAVRQPSRRIGESDSYAGPDGGLYDLELVDPGATHRRVAGSTWGLAWRSTALSPATTPESWRRWSTSACGRCGTVRTCVAVSSFPT